MDAMKTAYKTCFQQDTERGNPNEPPSDSYDDDESAFAKLIDFRIEDNQLG